MIPESRLIEEETVLRSLYLPTEVKLTKDALLRWLALALGLVSPKESRQSVIKILDVLIYFYFRKKILTPQDIVELSSKWQIDEKTIYYHLNRMKKLGLVTKTSNGYMLGKFFEERLSDFFVAYYQERFEKFLNRLREAIKTLETLY